ncbi:MAG: RNA polymerase sigma factor [Planctomycetes bacterium]|nr:RNA polymerase sigma factor [Planctomycetota bacterium]
MRRPVPVPTAAPTANASPLLAGPDSSLDGLRTGIQRYLRALGASVDEADDLAQEVLVVGCGTALPPDAAAARAFLRGVARNHWLRTKRWWRRRREREVALAVDELWQATADADDGEALLANLRECLGLLQARTRRALELHYRDGLDWNDVAAQIGLRPNGTKTLVQRARQALRSCIERRTT